MKNHIATITEEGDVIAPQDGILGSPINED